VKQPPQGQGARHRHGQKWLTVGIVWFLEMMAKSKIAIRLMKNKKIVS
jgi:hypothetical protein